MDKKRVGHTLILARNLKERLWRGFSDFVSLSFIKENFSFQLIGFLSNVHDKQQKSFRKWNQEIDLLQHW